MSQKWDARHERVKTFEPQHDKTCLREFPIRPETNRPKQPQKLTSLEISAVESTDIILSKQWTTKALIGLRGCAGWSAPLLFAYDIRHIFSWPGSFYTGQNHAKFFFSNSTNQMSRSMTKPTKWCVRPAKTQISLGIRPVWAESLLSTWKKHGTLATHWVHSEDSDQTGWMPRLIWAFAGRTHQFVGFVMMRLKLLTSFFSEMYLLQNLSDNKNFGIKWAKSWENLSLGVCDWLRLKPACSATAAS